MDTDCATPIDGAIRTFVTSALVGSDVVPFFLVTQSLRAAGLKIVKHRIPELMRECGFIRVDPPMGRARAEQDRELGYAPDPLARRSWSIPGHGSAVIYVRIDPAPATLRSVESWEAHEQGRSAPPTKKRNRGRKGVALERRRAIEARLERLDPDQRMVRWWIAEYVKFAARPDGRRDPDNKRVLAERRAAYWANREAADREAARALAAYMLAQVPK